MSNPIPESKPTLSMKPNTAMIVGKCTQVQRRLIGSENLYLHLVITPAPDEYTSPGILEVQSRKKLCEKDENVRALVLVTGYRNNFKATDKETGEIQAVNSARVTLRAIED